MKCVCVCLIISGMHISVSLHALCVEFFYCAVCPVAAQQGHTENGKRLRQQAVLFPAGSAD